MDADGPGLTGDYCLLYPNLVITRATQTQQDAAKAYSGRFRGGRAIPGSRYFGVWRARSK